MDGGEDLPKIYSLSETSELLDMIKITSEVLTEKHNEYQRTLQSLTALALSLKGSEVLLHGKLKGRNGQLIVNPNDPLSFADHLPVMVESAFIIRPAGGILPAYISLSAATLPELELVSADLRPGAAAILPLPLPESQVP